MADKVKIDKLKNDNLKNDKQPTKSKKKSGMIFKIILILLILLILGAASFAAGIYLKFIDMPALAEKWKLKDYPVVGQYFSQPQTNFETVDLEPESSTVVTPSPIVPPVVPPVVPPAEVVPEKKKVDESELLKQAKIKQQEEAKRLSKLSRLYGTMKPDEAVAIFNKMDDETVLVILNKMEDEQVAKIMALFDAGRAANLSQNMLRDRSPVSSNILGQPGQTSAQ